MYEDEDGTSETTYQANEGPVLPPFDAPKYREAISDLDMTKEQAREFLERLDFILRTCVDLGFSVESVQNFLPAMREFSMESQGDELEQTENTDAFNGAASKEKRQD